MFLMKLILLNGRMTTDYQQQVTYEKKQKYIFLIPNSRLIQRILQMCIVTQVQVNIEAKLNSEI